MIYRVLHTIMWYLWKIVGHVKHLLLLLLVVQNKSLRNKMLSRGMGNHKDMKHTRYKTEKGGKKIKTIAKSKAKGLLLSTKFVVQS